MIKKLWIKLGFITEKRNYFDHPEVKEKPKSFKNTIIDDITQDVSNRVVNKMLETHKEVSDSISREILKTRDPLESLKAEKSAKKSTRNLENLSSVNIQKAAMSADPRKSTSMRNSTYSSNELKQLLEICRDDEARKPTKKKIIAPEPRQYRPGDTPSVQKIIVVEEDDTTADLLGLGAGILINNLMDDHTRDDYPSPGLDISDWSGDGGSFSGGGASDDW